MYVSVPTAMVLSIIGSFAPLSVHGAPAAPKPAQSQQQRKQAAPTGPGNDFIGSLTWYSQQPELVLASISNNSTVHYSILAKNNLFDDAHPTTPLMAATLAGQPVTLVGTRWSYPAVEDSQFKDFPPGSVWERYFNMSEYIPPSSQYKTPTSECFTFALPPTVEALNMDVASSGQGLADLFLSHGLTQVQVDSNPIHMNVTVAPSTGTTSASGPTPSQALVSQPSGIILAPNQQNGEIVNPAQTSLDQSFGSAGTTFEINSSG
ncbi:MAG: hypothetical protein Q9219_006636 [cf. Caloplaca sp. 3 TL-2023]